MTQATIEERSNPIATASEPQVVRASERLWNLRWPSAQFGELTVAPGSFTEALPFIVEHFPRIFPSSDGRFLEEGMSAAKRRFLDECDVLLLREEGRMVGVWVGNPSDWSTYYARSIGVLPECRRRGIMSELGLMIEQTVAAVGVERIDVDTSPSNIPMNRALLSEGYMVTSTMNTERWGAMLRYTKFLTPAADRCFRRQFLAGPAPKEQDPAS